MKNNKADKYWDLLHDRLEFIKYDPNQIIFKDIFEKYLKKGGSCLEIGCYPGNFLIYFSNEFGYEVSGIDVTSRLLENTMAYLKANGVIANELICQDFMKYKPSKTYDLVCSFGFIEHFPNYEEIIIKHISMVKPGGTLVITCPNIRIFKHIVYLLYYRDCLSAHVFSSMKLRKWRRVLESNKMHIIYHNYYKTAGHIGVPESQLSRYQRIVQRLYNKLCEYIESRISYPNPIFSPYQISISQKI